MEGLLERLLGLPFFLVYILMAAAAAVENFVPPIPADVVVLAGGFVVARAGGSVWLAALLVWVFNVAGALAVYALGRRYGMAFFSGRWGRMLLRPGQLAGLSAFYHRYGFAVIFVSRFLPVFRAVVPIFAGVSQLSLPRTMLPLATASGIWYGTLVFAGAAAGENWELIAARLEEAGRWLYLAAFVLMVALLWWWRRSRRTQVG